jgi:hypothetical protein
LGDSRGKLENNSGGGKSNSSAASGASDTRDDGPDSDGAFLQSSGSDGAFWSVIL